MIPSVMNHLHFQPVGRYDDRSIHNVDSSRFLKQLFSPADLIEFRIIETWAEAGGKKNSRPILRDWLTTEEALARLPEFMRMNEVGNVFFGVNPRARRGGTKRDVTRCSCVWVDLDGVSTNEATSRWEAIQLPPTVLVNSGHGVHAYWKLSEPIHLACDDERSIWETTVKAFALILAGDSTQDCSRLLRLPGTWNVKNKRNGAAAVRCELAFIDESRVYPRSAFATFASSTGGTSSPPHTLSEKRVAEAADDTSLCTATIGRARDHQRIRGILRYLDREVSDRSRRDLSALLLLIQAGLSKAEIHSLVMSRPVKHSKFIEAGNDYFERTFSAAQIILAK